MMMLYGAPGWGSAIAEVMLTLAQMPYQFVYVSGFDRPGPARDRLLALNPLAQVPTLRLADGEVMTESAAIALMILDHRPGLAPPPGTAERRRFQRLLVWLVANVYPTFTYADYPARFAPDAARQLQNSCLAYRKTLYLWLDGQLGAPFALGEQLTLLDAYVVIMRSWGPRAAWFAANAPRLSAVADRVQALPVLREVLLRNEIVPAQKVK